MIIDKNVPMPKSNKGAPRKYPFYDMEVGDSVFFEDEPRGSQSSPACVAHQVGRKFEKKFTCRKEGNGVRIWRAE